MTSEELTMNLVLAEAHWRGRAIAAEAKVTKLTEELTWLDRGGGLGLDVHRRIREAIGMECRHEFVGHDAQCFKCLREAR